MKPPSLKRFAVPTAAWPGRPKKIRHRPTSRKAIIEMTLIEDRKNSSMPKDFTLVRFSTISATPNAAIPAHSGSCGHQ